MRHSIKYAYRLGFPCLALTLITLPQAGSPTQTQWSQNSEPPGPTLIFILQMRQSTKQVLLHGEYGTSKASYWTINNFILHTRTTEFQIKRTHQNKPNVNKKSYGSFYVCQPSELNFNRNRTTCISHHTDVSTDEAFV